MEIINTNEFAKVLLTKMYWEKIRQSFTLPKFRAIRYIQGHPGRVITKYHFNEIFSTA